MQAKVCSISTVWCPGISSSPTRCDEMEGGWLRPSPIDRGRQQQHHRSCRRSRFFLSERYCPYERRWRHRWRRECSAWPEKKERSGWKIFIRKFKKNNCCEPGAEGREDGCGRAFPAMWRAAPGGTQRCTLLMAGKTLFLSKMTIYFAIGRCHGCKAEILPVTRCPFPYSMRRHAAAMQAALIGPEYPSVQGFRSG